MKLTNIITAEYEQVEEKTNLKQIIKKSSVGLLIHAFEVFIDTKNIRSEEYCEKIIRNETDIKYSPEDITDFSSIISKIIPDNECYLISLFLTKLISLHNQYTNKIYKEISVCEYVIETNNFPQELSHFGKEMKNTHVIVKGNLGMDAFSRISDTSITVHGSVGEYAGANMRSGTIEIFGNCTTHLGFKLRSGKIILHGNSKYLAGFNMHDGQIIITGNAGKMIGKDSTGGKINLEDTYESIHPDTRATIYHKGIQIHPKK